MRQNGRGACTTSACCRPAQRGGQEVSLEPGRRRASAPPAPARDAAPDATRNASIPAAAKPRPVTELRVIEDDQVRIEETRVRGQLRRVTVAPKGSTMRPYEINVGAAGRDPSQDKSGAGQRVWSVLRF